MPWYQPGCSWVCAASDTEEDLAIKDYCIPRIIPGNDCDYLPDSIEHGERDTASHVLTQLKTNGIETSDHWLRNVEYMIISPEMQVKSAAKAKVGGQRESVDREAEERMVMRARHR
jgi:hypothetical protein